MRLTTKVTSLSVALATLLLVSLVALTLYSFRFYSLRTAEGISRTAAEIVRVSLTEAMVNGVIGNREVMLERLQAVEGLVRVHVVRGPEVVRQFGPGLAMERAQDGLEEQVLRTGEEVFQVHDDSELHDGPLFRATIPYTAHRGSEPDCLQCHTVAEGAVLGAITLELSLTELKDQAVFTSAMMLIPLSLFGILLVFSFRRMIRPLSDTAHDLQQTVDQSLAGDFTGRITRRTDDEIGQIAGDVNQLMAFLSTGLNEINDDVAQLTQWSPVTEDMLTSTKEMVGQLVGAAQFKQRIEEDETRGEVYGRLSEVIGGGFGIDHHSIYEVSNSQNRILPVLVDGEPSSDCRWCTREIQVRGEACRARRTGHIVDGVETPGICKAFRDRSDEQNQTHICLPVLQSGSVGSVVQLVFPSDQSEAARRAVPYLQVYLREAAPVIETKRLMDTLREANLRDPMTGLHNRRFLEEYAETMVAGVQRRKQSASILMLDLDHFKAVNDEYGHDTGDTLIRAVADILVKTVRTSDLAVRYGGEEFLVVLTDTPPEAAMEVAEKIRAKVERSAISVAGVSLRRTVSVGLAAFPGDSESFWGSVKRADAALYAAKDSGRNRVVRFSADLWPVETPT